VICTVNLLSQHPNEFWKINVPNGLGVVVLLWLQISLLLEELEAMNVDLGLLDAGPERWKAVEPKFGKRFLYGTSRST
jgi:hypothetical protein